MPNMSYCRFQNTLQDMRDCADHIHDTDGLSEEEREARHRLIHECREIVNETEGEEE